MNAPFGFVSAGAGTGKTHRLINEIVDAMAGGEPPESLLVTTFTLKAAGELVERARRRLFADGRPDAAHGLLSGGAGTMHAVAGRLVERFAFEEGLSPALAVLDDAGAARVFRTSVARALDGMDAGDLAALDRLGLSLAVFTDEVRKIVEKARANGLTAHDLPACAEASVRGLLSPLSPAFTDGAALEDDLVGLFRESLGAIPVKGDTFKNTRDARSMIEAACGRLAVGQPLAWADWLELTGVKAAKKSNGELDGVRRAAEAHLRHPGFQADVEATIRAAFAVAAEALAFYSDHKIRLGFLDFADQIGRARDLLGRHDIRAELAGEIGRVLVDEVQDTDPLQIDLFVRLAGLARASLWVGDPKQAIYDFRGADPDLVVRMASTAAVERQNGNRRSRSDLVTFTNGLFTHAFAPAGIQEDAVRLDARRGEPPGLPCPLAFWRLEGKSETVAATALAGAVRSWLDGPEARVVDPVNNEGRRARGGDVAVLCRTKARAAALAAALAARGLRVAAPADGLVRRPEAVLACAALRYLVDPRDDVAAAEIIHLAGSGEPRAWLGVWLGAGRDAAKALAPVLARLDDARPSLAHATPTEALDIALAIAGVNETIRAWPEPEARLGNLDALRGLAAEYERSCIVAGGAATAGGLAAWLAGVEKGGAQAVATGHDAVNVMTYHAAKGLEWPVVVLADLDYPWTRETDPFGVRVEAAPMAGFDSADPLANRRVRFWPRPYGAKKTGGLLTEAAGFDEAKALRARIDAEAIRLLYVGMTRARDMLVLTAREGKDGLQTDWLDRLANGAGTPLVELPIDEGPSVIRIAGNAYPTLTSRHAPPASDEAPRPRPAVDAAPESPRPAVLPAYRLRPSDAPMGAVAAAVIERVVLGGRVPLRGTPDMRRLGDGLHAVLAADRRDLGDDERIARAGRLLGNFGVADALDAWDAVTAANRLRAFLDGRWPVASARAEVPVVGRIEGRRVRGRIDLLIDTDERMVVIDHKSYPGPADTWEGRALEHAPQLGLYGALATSATGKPVAEAWVHLPLIGRMIRVG